MKNNNEEQSADLAIKRLSAIKYPADRTLVCKEQILSTKGHQYSNHYDTNLFIDADLSILGQAPGIYQEYCRQIRKEYLIYPTLIYNPGRKKVINHFLGMERIFKTDPFYTKYEGQARINLRDELGRL